MPGPLAPRAALNRPPFSVLYRPTLALTEGPATHGHASAASSATDLLPLTLTVLKLAIPPAAIPWQTDAPQLRPVHGRALPAVTDQLVPDCAYALALIRHFAIDTSHALATGSRSAPPGFLTDGSVPSSQHRSSSTLHAGNDSRPEQRQPSRRLRLPPQRHRERAGKAGGTSSPPRGSCPAIPVTA